MASLPIQLLLLAIRPQIDAAALQAAVSEHTDWNAVLRLARRHGVTVLLLRGLVRAGIDAPPILLDAARAVSFRNLRLLAELAEITSRLGAAGIPVLTLKGVPQSVLSYGDIGCRDSLDIDLAVQPQDMVAAGNVLTVMGYTEIMQAVGASVLGQRAFRHEGRRMVVDLHDRWSACPAALPASFAEVWEQRVAVPLSGGVSVSTMGGADRLVFLCVHGGRHRWERLLWLCDVAWELDRNPGLASLVRDRARVLGVERAFTLALDLVARLLGGQTPAVPVPALLRLASRSIAAQRMETKPIAEMDRLLSVLHDANLYDHWGGRIAEIVYRGRRLMPGLKSQNALLAGTKAD